MTTLPSNLLDGGGGGGGGGGGADHGNRRQGDKWGWVTVDVPRCLLKL